MAYYFAVETEKNSFEAVNIKRSGTFWFGQTYPEPYRCTLQEIDNYTSCFDDEESLKSALMYEKLLSGANYDDNLSIIYSEGLETRKVKGRILYRDSKKLIKNVTAVIEYIKNKYKDNDSTFFKKLTETLPESSLSICLVSQIASMIERKLVEGRENQTDENDVHMVVEAIKIYIYKSHVSDGTIVCTDEVNYENLHDLVAFISEYEETLRKDKKSSHRKTRKNAQ